jgi:hypothetical protein
MVRLATLRACAALLLVALTLLLTACPAAKPQQADMPLDDLEMLRGALLISDALRACQRETAEWPATIREAEPFLLRGEVWPVNPYTKQPVEEAASAAFDPAASVGKVYYEKFARDGVVVNYRLHVFGKTGLLTILDNTPGTLR